MPSMQTEDHVEISHLSFKRGERAIFDDVSLKIKRGKITAIMGPSGTGKTTLLKLIGAQLKPDSGAVLVNNIDIHKLNTPKLYQMRQDMGLLFQSGGLFTNLSVFENVAFPLREHVHLPHEMVRDLVLLQLEAVGLRGASELMPSELSGGMAHRVALARSLVMNPSLMMYDEPFTGQDPITMAVLIRLIKELNDVLNVTSIIVSHDVAETASIADYMYILAGGRIVGEGAPEQVMNDRNPWVEQFVHGLADGMIPYHYPAREFKEDLDL